MNVIQEATTIQKLERFFLSMWDRFADGCTLDGLDLQDALERSGLTEWRQATADEAARSEYDIEECDPLLFPTEEGRAVLQRAREWAA